MGITPPIEVANLGMWDSLILMVMALVVFGPRRLPEIGRQVGKLMYEVRKASNDFKFQMEEELRSAEDADRRKKDEERQRGLAISRGLFAARKEFESGVRQANRLVMTVQNTLLETSSSGQTAVLIDYVAAVDARTLRNVQIISAPAVIAVAARVGKTRLIDNVILTP